ncbi:MAG: DUF2306 domain-containing protein [Chitinophagales bacterium]
MQTAKSKWLPYLFYALLFAPFIFFTLLMCSKVVPYLSFAHAVNFLSTKTEETLQNPVFRLGFYVHITTSAIVLISGLPQFLPSLIRTKPSWHRWSGIAYVFAILLFAAPSGLLIALFANGGLPAKTGFVMQCLLWWFITLIAYLNVRKKNYREHINWMIRSYAITLAAMSLRTEGYIMHYFFHTRPIETYVTITWLSWVGNWFIAEILITLGLGNYLFKKYSKA